MLAKTYIQQELEQLDRLYKKSLTAASSRSASYYSKLAILELCGWVEFGMDDLARRRGKKFLKDLAYVQELEKGIIGRVYGFEYEKHFRRMMIDVVGITGLERVERRIRPVVLAKFQNALQVLVPVRNQHAHQYVQKTVATAFYAPSWAIGLFEDLFDGLKAFEKYLILKT